MWVTQTFEFLRENNYLYVDKTKDIRDLIHNEKIVFLSRPRRFGKSLLVSTLKSLFSGNKELFKGLYIYDQYGWDKTYNVIHLDMSDLDSSSTENLEIDLNNTIERIAEIKGISIDKHISLKKKFSNLIIDLYRLNGKEVVVLVDEYDAPILNKINDSELADANRQILQNFYQSLKNKDEYLRFAFITGISKFIHTSIFSKLNNPSDITLLSDYSTICGITHDELLENYQDYLHAFANKNNMDYDGAVEEFNRWYDGYSFDGEKKVFNPFSTLSALKNEKLSKYWFSTGTPHFLVDILKSENYKFSKFPIGNKRTMDIDLDNMVLSESDLNEIDPMKIKDIPLLFQGGYLTIDKTFLNENNETEYSLRIPNFEVEQAYEDNLIDFYLSEVEEDIVDFKEELWEDIKNGDGDSLADYLKIQFGEIPYYLNLTNKRDRWKLKQTVFLTLLKHLGFKTKGEVAISQGKIDATFRDKRHVVVCEVKYTQNQRKSIDGLVDEALSQIHEKQYYRLYMNKKFIVILLALAFKDVQINEKDVLTEVKCKIEQIGSEK